MKKIFFLTAAAAMLFAACQKTEVVYNEGPQEIAMFAVNNVATKAPVENAVFPADNMQVAAYLAGATADNVAGAGNYFEGTLFTESDTDGIFTGSKYWPVTSAVLNFLAVSEPKTSSPVATTFDTDTPASAATVVLADNKIAQYDLMYAAGQGVKNNNTPGNVSMVFKHALSWVNFMVKASEAGKITVKSIALNGAIYNGTLALSNSSYNVATPYESADAAVTANWSSVGSVQNGISVFNGTYACTTAYNDMGAKGLLVVPNAATSAGFTIVYSVEGAGDITYTTNFTQPTEGWKAGYKYTYNISFGGLNEIQIAPTVTVWDQSGDIATDDDHTL